MTQVTVYRGKDSSKLVCGHCKHERDFFEKGPCRGCYTLASMYIHKTVHVFEVIAGGFCVRRRGL